MTARRTYSEPAESFIRAAETVMTDLGFHYAGRGCPCVGSPLVYIDQDNYKVELYPARQAWRVKHGNATLNHELYTGAEALGKYIKTARA